MSILHNFYHNALRPGYFAPWACAKKNELSLPVKKRLENDTVMWDIGEETESRADHIEISGLYASSIISYGKNQSGALRLMKHVTVPTLRTQPNYTQSSYSHNFLKNAVNVKINNKCEKEFVKTVHTKGTVCLLSQTDSGVSIKREFIPSRDYPVLIEKITITNYSKNSVNVDLKSISYEKKLPAVFCVEGPFFAKSGAAGANGEFCDSKDFSDDFELKPNESKIHYGVYYALSHGESFSVNLIDEVKKRREFVDEMFCSLRIETPYKEIDAQFSHCVLRGSESIFMTKGGLMHAPGGGNYYAALWTNDQCEYANPFFPFSGYQTGIEQSINCYRHYEKYMDKSDKPMKEKRALVTSVIAEGDGFWNGAGDRGDGSMYAYGLGRFLLEMGDKALMKSFYDDFVWCIDFALSRKNDYGVIESDSDELENRFESSNANLFTSCLTYDALDSGVKIAEILNDNSRKDVFSHEKEVLRENIDKYFAKNVEGFETYRYYDKNDSLRAWICMPLTVEIFDRADGTIKALFSEKLYKNAMLKTDSKDETTWDRSLLFALRGTFLAGYAKEGLQVLLDYCNNRLTGTHSPYPFEAYPEGNRAHLAAESLLFARVITEGLFGLKAVGYRQVRIAPQLSEQCNELRMKNIRLFSECFDIAVKQDEIVLICNGKTYISNSSKVVFDFQTMAFFV